jgi:16S rRNA processing protein RimM
MSDEELIAVGRVVTTHGLRGELRVQTFNPDSTAVRAGAEIILRHRGRESPHRVLSARPHKRVFLVVLAGCDSIEDAETLVGAEVCVPRKDLPPPGPNEAYHFELEGMTVVTTAGEPLGTVAEVLALGSNDICVVRDGAREHLIPMIADVVKEVDRKARRLVIEPLPGLLD